MADKATRAWVEDQLFALLGAPSPAAATAAAAAPRLQFSWPPAPCTRMCNLMHEHCWGRPH